MLITKGNFFVAEGDEINGIGSRRVHERSWPINSTGMGGWWRESRDEALTFWSSYDVVQYLHAE